MIILLAFAWVVGSWYLSGLLLRWWNHRRLHQRFGLQTAVIVHDDETDTWHLCLQEQDHTTHIIPLGWSIQNE